MANAEKYLRREPGIKEIVVAIQPDTSFDEIVERLKVTLTLPELPGQGGCNPCLSGLDRFLLESVILERTR